MFERVKEIVEIFFNLFIMTLFIGSAIGIIKILNKMDAEAKTIEWQNKELIEQECKNMGFIRKKV